MAGEGESLGSEGETPAVVWNPRPAYPHEARIRGQEGTVEIHLTVGPDGRVGEAKVIRSSGHLLLDAAALAALRRWRYEARPGRAALAFVQAVQFRLDAPGAP